MEIFKEQIDEKTIEGLQHLIHANFFCICSPQVEIDPINNQYWFFDGVSLFYEKDSKRGFINIKNDCIETIDRNLGYKLEVLLANQPMGLIYEYGGLTNPPVSVDYGRRTLTKVEIYNFHKIGDDEDINYDAAIYFYTNDGYVLVVSTPNDYSQRVELKIRRFDQLVKEIDTLNLRVVIE